MCLAHCFCLGFITTLLFSTALISISAVVFLCEFFGRVLGMKILASLLFSVLYCLTASAHQWLYPVAQLADGNVLLIYQKESAHSELFSWDPVSGKADKTLSSCYTPAGISVVPGTDIFSFIDNGRIRIKQSNKRSAPALDSPMPLYDISIVSWTRNVPRITGFFSAQGQGNHAIYACSLTGDVAPVLEATGVDYRYPSCTESALFYIVRRAEQTNPPWQCKKHAQCRCHPLDSVDAFLYSIETMPSGGRLMAT